MLDLAAGAAEAAFGLHRQFVGEGWLDEEGAVRPAEPEGEKEEESLPWDTVEEPLPRDLELVWKRVQEGRRLEIRELLDNIPTFATIPKKALVDNHRTDSGREGDKLARVWEQSPLNLLRV